MSMPGARVADRADDQMLVQRLRAGDERAFTELVRARSPGMLRLARTFVSSRQAAEDVVQEAWLGVLQGLDQFQGRSSLRTWALTILVNRAKPRGVRDSRTVPCVRTDRRGRSDGRRRAVPGPRRPVPRRLDLRRRPAPVAAAGGQPDRGGDP